MVAKYLPLPVSVTVSQWQDAGHRLIKGSNFEHSSFTAVENFIR